MEEAKAAAYYDEVTRKGERAARFKQGLGFSSSRDGGADAVPARASAVTSSSFLSSFVRASSPNTDTNTNSNQFQKHKQLETIQRKLKKKPSSEDKHSRHRHRSTSGDRDSNHRRDSSRIRSGSRDRRGSRRRYRSRSLDRDRHRHRGRERRSRSRSVSDEERGQGWGRQRSRSSSPRRESRSQRRVGSGAGNGGLGRVGIRKERNCGVDYSRLIQGYDQMTPSERVKAKMKLQLSETAKKDDAMGSGWERFEFDKDAPLGDEEIEVVEDDAVLAKRMSQSFRFSAVEANIEDKIKAAHDEAMFGAPVLPSSSIMKNEQEVKIDNDNIESDESLPVSTLLSNTVLVKQQGSWRDRARKV